MKSICLRNYVLILFALLAITKMQAQDCPMVFSPVTGKGGVTYLNACFAEAADEGFYTQGVAFGSCIDVSLMEPNTVCGNEYAPVVGCNGAIYRNSCEATKYGVTSYLPQEAMVDDSYLLDDCFDYQVIQNAFPEAFNYANGILTVNCPGPVLPVCGCNGIDYASACEAEASGVIDYTYGVCSTQTNEECIDEEAVLMLNPNNCDPIYNPVCGCNDMTYVNQCAADNSGVNETSRGNCGNFAWREAATLIQCGQPITGNTAGSRNLISNYNSCTNVPLLGAEDVYVIHKTEPGDLQVYLEMDDASADLDLFVLDGMNTGLCLGQSIGPVGQYVEGVVVDNAPIGTYYIVVDAEHANVTGSYTLQTGCGFMNTENALEIQCGVPMTTSNITGDNNMLAFNCTNTPGVSGPEMIYTFSIVTDAVVSIDLFNMTADMNMYLLNQLDLQNCIGSSVTEGLTTERIALPLAAGSYFVIVDGGNGATGDYMLNLSCGPSSSCNLANVLTVENSECNEASGSIRIDNIGSVNSNYIFSIEGPVTDCATDTFGEELFENLPSGNYMVYTTDTYGCTSEERVTVASGNQNFFTTFESRFDSTTNTGTINIDITGGFPPFTIFIEGIEHGTTNSNTYQIEELEEGNYDITVMDATECQQFRTAAITNPCNVNITLVPMDEDCGGLGNISIDVTNGTPPFAVTINGAVATGSPFAATWFSVNDLSAGFYTVVVTDANGCSATGTSTVNFNVNMITLTTTPTPASCSSSGSIAVSATGGVPPYSATLNGTPVGSFAGSNFTIPNVAPGTYTLMVQDAYSCTQSTTVTVGGSNTGLTVSTTNSTPAVCGTLGNVTISVSGGTAPYSVSTNGTSLGTFNTSSFTTPGLAPGNYTITITDANGCSGTTSATIGGSGSGVSITSATPTAAGCGLNGSISLNLAGGTAPYNVTLDGTTVTGSPFNSPNINITNVAPGNHTVVVTDANGCTDMTTVTVGGNTGGVSIIAATPTSAGCGMTGSIAVEVTGGTAPYAVTLDGVTVAGSPFNNVWFNITNVAAGNHTIVVTDANGCTDTTTVTVGGNTGGVSIVAATPTAAGCGTTGSIAVEVTGGTAPYAVTLDGVTVAGSPFNNVWFNITNVAAGNHTIVVTDANGCTDTTIVTVSGGNSGGVTIVTANPTPASCNSPGSIAVDLSGGTAPYTVRLNGSVVAGSPFNNAWFSLDGLQAGTYTLEVTDANGCIDTTTVTVTNMGGNISLTPTPTSAGCNGTYGSISVAVAGGTPPFSVNVNGSFAGNSSQNPFNIINIPAGNYTISVLDANGCSATTYTTVTGGSGGVVINSATPTASSCYTPGSIGVDLSGGVAPYNVTLNGAPAGTFNSPWFTLDNLAPGSYTLVVTDANGCSDQTIVAVQGSGGGLTLTPTGSTATCGGLGSIAVQATGGVPPYSVTVNGSFAGNTSNNPINIVNVPAGTYTISVTDANGCTGTTTGTVNGGGAKLIATGNASPASCASPGMIQLDVVGGNGPFDVFLDGNLVTTTNNRYYIIQNVAAGNHTVKIVDANGCEDEFYINVTGSGGNISVNATNSGGSTCGGGNVGVDLGGGTPPYTISVNGSIVGTTPNAWFTLTGMPSGSSTILVTDANGCTGTTNIVVTSSGSKLTVTATSSATSCSSNGMVQLDITGGNGPFDIFLDGNFVTNTDNRYYILQNVTAGDHTIKVVDKNGCDDDFDITVTNGGLFALGATSTPGSCSGGGTINLDITGGTPPFDVELDGVFITTTNDRWFAIDNVAPGGYTIKITDANGCMTTHQELVEDTGLGMFTFSSVGFEATCVNPGSIKLNIPTTSNPPWEIELNGMVVTTTSNPGFIIDNLQPDTYNVKITNANGCMATSTATVGDNRVLPTFNVVTQASHCHVNTGKIIFDITSGTPPFNILVNGNVVGTTSDNTFEIEGLGSGDFEVGVGFGANCIATNTVIVDTKFERFIIKPVPLPATCDSLGFISVDIKYGVPPWDIELNGQFQFSTSDRWIGFSGLQPGIYTIRATDVDGCFEEETVEVTQENTSTATVSLSGTPSKCGQSTGSITGSITGGTAPFDIFLDGNQVTTSSNNTFTIPNVSDGVREVTVTSGGCTISESITIDRLASFSFNTFGFPATCAAAGRIQLDITGNQSNWDIELNGNFVANTDNPQFVIQNLQPGNYDIRVTDSNGCVATNTQVVTNMATPPSITVTPVGSACNGSSGQISIDITNGGNGPFDILLDGNVINSTSNNSFIISNVAAGTYEVGVRNRLSCVSTQTVTVTTASSPISLSGTSTACGCGLSNGTVTVNITGGDAPYDVFVDGSLFGSTLSNTFTATGLLPGNYDIRVVDVNGCDATTQQSVQSSGNLDVTTTTTACGCNGITGSITVSINDGIAPYEVFLDGTFITTTTNNFYTIDGLQAGTFTLEIRDSNNCTGSVTETVQHFTNISFNVTGVDAGCGTTNGSININNITGTAPYTIFLNGSSIATTNDNSFVIDNLAGGSYVVSVSDANTCDADQTIQIGGSVSNISINATAFAENCDAMDGNIALDIMGGVEPFEIFLDGVLVSTTNNRWYNIMGLVTGTYNVRVVDANGCDVSGDYTVNGNTAINVNTTSTSGSCGATNGTITVQSTGGLAPYTVFLNGVSHGSSFNQFFTIAGVVPGTYDVRVVDANGCETTVQETVGGSNTFAATAVANDVSCGILGSIVINIQTGTAPFDIFVNGNSAGSTFDNTFTVSNLATGDYDVRIVDAGGCEDNKRLTVGGSNALDIVLSAQPDTCGNNGVIAIQIQNGNAPYTIALDGVTVGNTSDNNFQISNLASGEYLVNVTDRDGCANQMTVNITNSGTPPNAQFTFIFNPGGVVKFFSNNPGGTVFWEFSDGTTSTDTNPIKSFSVGQTFDVCLTANNTCGTAQECNTLTVPTVFSSNLSFTVGDIAARPDQMVAIPIEVDHFDRVMSFQYTVQLKNNTVGKITGVSEDGLSNVNFNILDDETIMVDWQTPNTADGSTLADDQVIFNILVEVDGARGNCTPADFVNVPMNVEVRQRWFNDPTLVVPNFFDGQLCISNAVNISGTILREDAQAIPEVEVTCNSTQSILTDPITGEYVFSNSQLGESCLILPTKDGDDQMGLSVMDIIKLRRHTQNISNLDSPYKIIAADVNRDKDVDENDISIIGDIILGNQAQLHQGDAWRFLPANWTFTDPDEPFSPLFPVLINLFNLTGDMPGQDFMGVKLGDIDNSLNLPSMVDDVNMNGNLTFHTDDQAVDQDDEFVLEIRSSDFENIAGFQMELNYDPARFEFVEMLAGELAALPQNMIGTSRLNEGVLSILWYDRSVSNVGITQSSDEVLFRLKFNALQGFNSMGGLFEIGTTMTKDIGVNINNQYLDIGLHIDGATSSTENQDEAAFELEQNFPNPFSDQTFIGFTLPSPQTVGFELVDQQGRVIERTQQFYNKGYQQIIVDGKDLPTSGVYFYRMTVADQTITKKLIYMTKR